MFLFLNSQLICSNFMATNTPTYGNCFTFNFANNDLDSYGGKRVSTMPGPNFGLDLVINVEQSKYLGGGITQSAGARVMVHSASEHPQPHQKGHQVAPNSITSLSMHEVLSFTVLPEALLCYLLLVILQTQLTVTRYEDPYTSNCTKDWSLSNLTGLVPNITTWPYNVLVRILIMI